ncbi:histidinol-phosphate transaminase [Buchananella felis]|uniref:histidinol-phosphate transaminase n=1 Tax=Buchananella felis TaxID=3231492 RepID=UPI0035285DA5
MPNLDASAVQIRAAIRALPAYVPGARAQGAVKLSSNENPFPPSPAVVAAIAAAAGGVNRYPDMAARELVEELAQRLGVEPAQIVAGNGSVAVLAHVLAAVCESGTPSDVVMPWRSFEAYPITVEIAGGRCVQVPLTADHRHDIHALAAAVRPSTKALLVCSPNNPTGSLVTRAELEWLLSNVPSSVLVILDEAYLEFARAGSGGGVASGAGSSEAQAVVADVPGGRSEGAAGGTSAHDVHDGISLIERYPNLVVLRTFSKAYALAGARVGYAVASSEVAAAIRATATPFGVNSLAVAAACAALAEEERMRAQVTELVAERERVAAALARAGWSVAESRANFVWLSAAEQDTAVVLERCRAGNVLVRPFPEGVRISIGTRAENDALLAALGQR